MNYRSGYDIITIDIEEESEEEQVDGGNYTNNIDRDGNIVGDIIDDSLLSITSIPVKNIASKRIYGPIELPQTSSE
jgi:hypothetical protein